MYYETIEKFFEEKTYNKYIKTYKETQIAWKAYLYKNKNKTYNKKTSIYDSYQQVFIDWGISSHTFDYIKTSHIKLSNNQLKQILHRLYVTKKPIKLNQNKLKCLG